MICAEGVHAYFLEDGGAGELRAGPPEGAAREQLEPSGAGGAGAFLLNGLCSFICLRFQLVA